MKIELFDYAADNIVFTIAIGIAVFSLVLILLKNFYISKPLPPGPYGLPIFGYLPFITKKPFLKLQQLKEKYGPIYSLRIGSQYVVVLCDYDVIKTAFTQDAYIGRPFDLGLQYSKETKETGAFHTTLWKEQRKFMIQTLKILGIGEGTMETHIEGEISELLAKLAKQKGKPLILTKYLAPSTSNNISLLVFGKRRNAEDPKRIMLNDFLKKVGQSTGLVGWQLFFPWIKACSKFVGLYKGISPSILQMKNYIREEVEEHEATIDENNPKDLIDHYLLEIQKRKEENNTTFLKPIMVDLVRDLFGAGSDSVRITVEWLILISASFQNVQRNVQKEIDNIIGQDRFPNKSDINLMPYTEAVITETLRWRTNVAITPLRYTLANTKLGPYFIPKGTRVIANLWGIHHDPELWGNDADEFRPERFLSEDKKTVHKPDYYIPFSIGKRYCPGKQLALFEVFLYYTAILQKFDVSLPKGVLPDFEGQYGMSIQSKPHEVYLRNRH